jgi:hypothetical protein
MQAGEILVESANLLLDHHINKLLEVERLSFMQDALFIMPIWKSTMPITRSIFSLWIHQLLTLMLCVMYEMGCYNHIAKDCSLPAINVLVIGAVVVLLVNFIVEKDLYNGAVGKVVQIFYDNKSVP